MPPSTEDEKNYLRAHFAFNADQRLKAFNFFVIFSVFADGGVFTAVDKNAPRAVFMLIGAFVVLLAILFLLIDLRSQALLRLSNDGLREYEKKFPAHSRLFALEKKSKSKFIRYSVAFRVLFAAQILFGLGVVAYGWLCV